MPGVSTPAGGLSAAAVEYAAAGLAVFPCVPDAKRPLTRHGFTDATTDLDRITAWWRRWPRANIGLPTGSRFVVLDIDVHPTGSGFPALARARRAGVVAGWSHLVRTPSGGVHLYFPASARDGHASWSCPRKHVDFRGVGGYVVAPPSRVVTRDGHRRGYTLMATGTETHPLDAAALRRLLTPPSPEPRSTQRRAPRQASGEGLAAWLASQQEGNRNRALFWAACRRAEGGIPKHQSDAELGSAAARTGLDEREVQATIASAYRTTACRPADPTAASTGRPGP